MSGVDHSRAAIDTIATMLRGMTLRPRMYGDGCCIETEAGTLMDLRRILLGVGPDSPCQPGPRVGVCDRLLKERFGTSQMPAYCHLRDPDESRFALRVAEFIGEWWQREQKAVPDPGLDQSEDEALLATARAFLAGLPEEKRGAAHERRACAWSHPEYAVENYGARIEDGDVVWPDGERYPRRPQ